MKQKWKRIGSLILSVCMVFTMLPTMAFAETGDVDSGTPLGVSGTITAFEKLSAEVAEQTVETGTAEDELNLPDELMVTVTTGAAITATVSGNATATDSEAEEPEKVEPEEVETIVDVSGWTSDPDYDGDMAGVYTFTPSLALPKGLTVAEGVYAPQIAVTVDEAAEPLLRGGSPTLAAGDIDITGFWPVADKNAGTAGNAIYATAEEVIAALPTTTFASIPSGGGTLAWPVTTWTDTDGYNPDVAASYTFIGVLGEATTGYTNTNNYAPTVEVVVKAPGNDVTSSFTDANFLAAVRTALGIASNAPVTDSACAEVEVLDVQQKNIQSLAGIEHFTALKILACHSNQLTSLPALPSGLTTLECGSNQLTSLPALPSGLTMLTCHSNQLTSLPVLPSGLITLDCSSNRLSALDIRGLSALTSCFAADQTVSLTLTGSGNSYTANIELNNPDGLSSGLNYWFGVLTSTDKEITTSAFVVRIGEAASPYKLTGMLNLTYVENGTATPTVSGFRAERRDADSIRFYFTPSTTGKYGYVVQKKGESAPTNLPLLNNITSIGEFNIDTTSYGAVATDILVVYLQVENAEGVKSEIYSLEVPAYTPPTDAKAPSIIEQPTNATYVQNAAATDLIVLANSTDGGTLSYQWYSNTTNSTVGGTPVSSSTTNECTPSTSTVGTTYYYCVVTNTNNKATTNKTATTTSEIATVTVNPLGGGTAIGTMDIGGETGKDLSVNQSGTGWTWTASSATLTITGDITGDIKFVGTGDVTIAVAGTHTVTGRIICNARLLTINGGGTLNVNGAATNPPAVAIRTSNGLTIDNVTVNATTTDTFGRCVYIDAGDFTMESGTLNANGVQTGLQVESGNINISGTANVAASNSSSFAIITNGRITIGGNAVVTGDGGDIGTGILAENGIIINGGAVTARGKGIMSYGAISGNTGGITVNGGSLTVGDASASSVNGNIGSDLTVSGGVVTFTGTVSGTTSHTGGTLNGNAPSGGTVTGTMDIGGETVSDLRSNAGDISAKGWAWNAATATLTLNSSYTGSPIAVNCQSTDTVNLIYTGDVSITSGTASTIYCEGSLGIIGSGGTLTLNSTSSNSLYCAIEVNRALTVGGSADVNATCAGSGTDPSATVIYAKFGVTVSGSANLTANPTGADVSGIWVEGGDITISTTGTVTVGGGGTGGALALHNGRKLNMSGGTLALTGNPLAGRQFADLNITSGSIKIDGTPVYRALLTLPGTNTSTVVSAVSAPTSGYGISSKNPNSSGQLCFLLPAGSQTVTLTAGGNTYTGTVNVTTDNGATATLTKGSTAPTITVTRHPQNVTVTQGRISGALTTEAVASNGKPVSYQWYRWIGGIGSDNTEIMTGETNNTLTIPTNLTAGTYRYSCTYTAEGCEFVEGNVAIVTVKEPSGGGDGSSGGGGGGGGYTPTPIIPTDKQPDMPTVAKPSVSGMVKEGILSATITEQMVNDALKAAQDAAKKSGKELDGIALDFNVTGSGSYTNLNATIDAGAIDRLKEAGVKFIKIGSAVLDVTLDMGAIAEIDKQTSGTVTVSAKKITKLSDAAKKLIGNRPVFDITVSCQKNGKTEYVSNFGKGAVTLGIAYKATDKESKGNLFGVYVDKNGKPQLLTNSSYDNTGRLIFSRNSLSIYGVGYKAIAPAFTDTTKHWAKDNIDFVASRDLISGTSATTFAPNTAITRADFLMALGRLSGVDVSIYKTSSFTDVKLTDTAMPYIEWAVKNKIVSGYGNGKFGPNDSITREQMAVMMTGYAKATGYKLPVSKQAITFADDAKISAYAKDAVKAIQQTGVINGKDNNCFDPQGNATRAEASTILRRFVELVIDEGTARGWVQNDAGQWQWIGENGKPVVGWLTAENGKYHYYFTTDCIMVSGKWLEIDGKWYYFYVDGSLAKSTKVDGYEVGPDGVRKTK